MSRCAACGAENPSQARFCNQCGKPLDGSASAGPERSYTPQHLIEKVLKHRSALEGERKRVTVLFADIKGSTALAMQAGPEAWHGILDRFFGILSGAVHRYEGTVNQYTGDGIMALFGAPVAHEDHAQRACFAALDMSSEVRKFADELRLRDGINLSMRIGINTGEVVVGRIGDDLRMDYTAQGLTVNLAARMEHICEPGRIYLACDTTRQVSGYFELRALGKMQVDGAPEPIEVTELMGRGALQTRLARQMARGDTRFVGRESEFRSLSGLLDRAAAEDGQVAAVVGQAGIGKSRLCHEFLLGVEARGTPVYRTTGVPYGRAVPLMPVQQLLRAKMGLDDKAGLEQIRRTVAGTLVLEDARHARLLPAILGFLGVGNPADSQQSGELYEQVVETLCAWLVDSEAAQVLLFEDLHFLDAASEAFLEQLCRSVAGSRTLLLLNFRPEYVSEWLVPHIDEQIPVAALGEDSLRDLVADAIGSSPALETVVATVCARANGNPFYAEEAVFALVEEGYLQGQHGTYELLRPIEEWAVPDTVHALIASRLDRLEGPLREIVHSAAVIGQQFELPLLQMLAERSDELEEDLSLLEDAGFVHQRSGIDGVSYGFCHPLVQEVAYQTQLENRRARIHLRLAKHLETGLTMDKTPCELAVRIAHHFERGGDKARAGFWNLQAGRGLGSNDMNVSRDQFLGAVLNLDAAEGSPEVIRGRVRARAGLIRSAQFVEVDERDVERYFVEAERMATELGDIPAKAELYISASVELLHRGQSGKAARLASRATDLCVESGAGQLVERFRVSILITHNAAGVPQAGIDCANRGAGTDWLERPIDEDNFLSRGFYAGMLIWLGRMEEAGQQLAEALAFAQREDRDSSWMHAFKVDLAWFSGHHEDVLHDGRRALEIAQTIGTPFFQAIAGRGLALAHILRGEYSQALEVLQRFEHLVKRGAFAYQMEANYLAVQAEALAGLQRHDQARLKALAAIQSGRECEARVWELRAWISLLRLPLDVVGLQDYERGLQRMQLLVEESDAGGFLPWLDELRAQIAEPPQRESLLAAAQAGYLRIGAGGHAARLEAMTA